MSDPKELMVCNLLIEAIESRKLPMLNMKLEINSIIAHTGYQDNDLPPKYFIKVLGKCGVITSYYRANLRDINKSLTRLIGLRTQLENELYYDNKRSKAQATQAS